MWKWEISPSSHSRLVWGGYQQSAYFQEVALGQNCPQDTPSCYSHDYGMLQGKRDLADVIKVTIGWTWKIMQFDLI